MDEFVCDFDETTSESHVLHHLHRLERIVTNIQSDLDAATTLIGTIATSVVALQAGYDALKAELANAGVQPDTTAFDAALADLKAKVDAATADEAPAATAPAASDATTPAAEAPASGAVVASSDAASTPGGTAAVPVPEAPAADAPASGSGVTWADGSTTPPSA